MNVSNYKQIYTILIFFMYTFPLCLNAQKPKLTVVMVIDQCAYRYLEKLYPHLNYGIKTLIDNGVNYTNAHHPHAKPATATGHAALNTGAFAQDHGFIANKWMLPNGKKITAVSDDTETARLLTSPENAKLGASARYLMTDGISDQFILSATPDENHHVYSLSYKNRAAIATAGKLGKAIWFDQSKGLFSSSRSYFTQLPLWVEEFNTASHINALSKIEWNLAYPDAPEKYNFFDINEYSFSRPEKSIIGTITLNTDNDEKNRYYWYMHAPDANRQLLHLAKNCISTHVSRDQNDHLLLWICVSGPDKLGHTFGPESKEVIDMMYHLDKDIQDLMQFAQNHVGTNEVLFAFTSDHGVSPVPEQLHEKGLDFAVRTNKKSVIQNINAHLEKKFGIEKIIASISMPHITLNKEIWPTFDKTLQKSILKEIKTYFMNVPGVKNIWTVKEIQKIPAEKYSFIDRLKKQCYPNRGGDLVFQMQPFAVLSSYSSGANHKTPYNYDTHVPLIIYQPGIFERKTIRKPVWTTQFANTLSQILQTPQPSCAELEILPKLFE